MTDNRTKHLKILNIVFLIVLFLYPLRHIWLGVELTDSAYSAGNYRFSEQINSMWFFSTFLANVMGKFLSSLPAGNTLMGLNGYTALFISIVAVAVYHFFVKHVKVPMTVAFLGEMLAISLCWCPTTILYNYMTYFFFNLAVIVLYLGLVKEKRLLLFLAGILLGMNVLVRFPNLAEAALIASLWYYGVLQRKRIKDILQETGICIVGYLAGIGGILAGIALRYGLDAYVDAIVKLMSMPSDASDYTLYSMILTVLLDYKASSRWLICMILLCLVGCLVTLWVNQKTNNDEADKGKAIPVIEIIGKLIFLGMILVMFRWWYAIGVFNVKYYTYESMFQWVAVFLIITILICAYMILSKREEITRNQKLLASLVLILIAVTPLGSNNHLYPNMNNMFLVFPFALSACSKCLSWMKQYDGFELYIKEKEYMISVFPIKAMLAIFLMVMSLQCLLFGAVFTFRDGMSGQKRDTRIENNAILRGMVTNHELAIAIEELTAYVEAEGFTEHELILYGQIPATSYILDMPSAISTTWPDLRSYSYSTMVNDMKELEGWISEKGKNTPLIIVGEEPAESDAKWKLITDFMNQYEYKKAFENTRFKVYVSR